MGTTEDFVLGLNLDLKEEEEEVLESALKCRPSRRTTPPPPAETSPSSSSSSPLPNTSTTTTTITTTTVITKDSQQDGGDRGGGGEELLLESEKSIYFDTNNGTETGNGNGGDSAAGNKLGNGESIFARTGADILKCITAETNYQNHKIFNDEEHSGLHLLHSENESEIETASSRSVENQHRKALQDSKYDWDVERVIEKQETHDLYCPNCNSCITKRVILRKRKRRIQSLQDDSKREKLEVVESSSLARNEQEHNTVLPDLNGSPPSVGITDQDRETGPDVFRCLSCFSLFIPSVATLKSIWIFKDRSERENAQNPQQIPAKTGSSNEDDKDANFSSLLLVDSDANGQVNISTSKISTEEKNGQVSIHVVETRIDRHNDRNKKIEGDDKNATFSSLLLVDSDANGQVNISTSKTSTEEQSGQVSIHVVETRIDTSDRHNDGNKKIEGGYDVMQDQNTRELSNPLAYRDTTLSYKNRDSVSNASGAQHPAFSNTTQEDSKLFHLKEGGNISIMTKHESYLSQDKRIGMENKLEGLPVGTDAGKDVIRVMGAEQVITAGEVLQGVQTNANSSTPVTFPYREIEYGGIRPADEDRFSGNWDILKSIVYGGLVESITSLGLVSSAAGGDASTLNIVALGLASVIGGLFIIAHGLMDLKNEQYEGVTNPNRMVDRYHELLGRRTSFGLHSTVAVLSYLVFGLVAPITYGFSFRKSDNEEYKLIAVAAASLICITLLAFAKAYVRKPPKAYIQTVLYFITIGVMSSGLSYVIGMLIKALLDKLGLFEPVVIDPVPPSSFYLQQTAVKSSWGSY